ncbi:phosphate acetyltransferase [bacterium]|nr:phosphate acetyltransferase [bacterium]
MSDIISRFIERTKKTPKKIVFPEGEDIRIIEAASIIKSEEICIPVLLGDKSAIDKAASEAGFDISGVQIVNPQESSYLDEFAEKYSSLRKNISLSMAKRIVRRSLYFGAMMVSQGIADGMVGGIASTTASLIQAGAMCIGFEQGISTPSSFFIMVLPEFLGEKNKVLIYADAAVTISPSAPQLAEIAIATAMNAKKLLGIEPKVAMLSFSTKGSASHSDVDKVVEATKIARQKKPDLNIDGELQADTALVPKVAEKKVKESNVAGKANVLIFPDLDAANIAYKLTQYIGGAKAYGPILQGFRKPINDLSRGASVQDVVGVTAITAVRS